MATTDTKKSWTYDEFKQSQSTLDADKNRKDLETQKPGEFTYDSYAESDAVKQAKANYQQYLSQKPGAYQSAWQTQLDDTLNKILNREKFSYDLNGDALYQQYKDQYTLQGQQAMMDTMGQAAAMTGGYGNSYAQTVGQQTYQGYLQQLNDKVPELYQLALDKYNQEGQDLYNQYGLYADRDAQDYGRHRDAVSDYYTELSRLTDEARYQGEQDYNKYMDAYNMAYGQHRDSVSDWQTALNRADSEFWNQYTTDYGQYSDNRGLSYQQNRDSVADDQWNQSFAYGKERDAVADSQWQTSFDEGVRQFNANIAESQASRAESARQFNASQSKDEGTKYKSLDVGSNAYNAILADIDMVEDIDSLYDLAERYIALGYDPDQVNAMTSGKASALQKAADNEGGKGLPKWMQGLIYSKN